MTPRPILVLVRHGETVWTERGLLHGRLDSPLSQAGRAHAERTAERLRGEPFDAFYTSPQGRALETSRILSRTVGLAAQPVPELREADFGILEGWPRRVIHPNGLPGYVLRPFVFLSIVLSGESPRRVSRRISRAIDLVLEQHPTGRLLIVTHWGVLSHLMAHLVDQDPAAWKHYGPWDACGVSELAGVDGPPESPTWRVVRLNDTSHLSQERPS